MLKKYPNTWDENKMAGMEWMRSFMNRHRKLSYGKPENTSIARANAFITKFDLYQILTHFFKIEQMSRINIILLLIVFRTVLKLESQLFLKL